MIEVLSKRWERKARIRVLEHAHALKQYEREVLLETMLALASKGQLTPERISFFLTALWDEDFEDINHI